MHELIEKLKDKDYVRAFGLMTLEEQECFRKVGKENLLVYHSDDTWNLSICDSFSGNITYAIKPNYQPEPAYKDRVFASTCDAEKDSMNNIVGVTAHCKCGNVFCDDVTHGKFCLPDTESEFVDLEIVKHAEGAPEQTWWLGVWADERVGLPYAFTHLHCPPSPPNFVCFWEETETDKDKTGYRLDKAFWIVGLAADKADEGKKVYARFRRYYE